MIKEILGNNSTGYQLYSLSRDQIQYLCLCKLWATATVQSLLAFTLDLWNDRCDTIHWVDDEDAKGIIKDKAIKRVGKLYAKNERIEKDYKYLFK